MAEFSGCSQRCFAAEFQATSHRTFQVTEEVLHEVEKGLRWALASASLDTMYAMSARTPIKLLP